MADHSSRSWIFDVLTRNELTELAPEATVVVPIGSTEQHGHHLPVRTDAAVVTAIARRAVPIAAEQVPILLAPTLPFGFAHHHLPFGGTISLRSQTYVDVLTDIGTGLASEGFRRLVFLNGHGGNDPAMRMAADRLVVESKLALHVAAASYWTAASAVFTEAEQRPAPGHAGNFETSLMLAIDPDLVRLDARPADPAETTILGRADIGGAEFRRPGTWQAGDGRSDDARLATVEAGTRLLEAIVTQVAGFLVRFHESVPAA